MKPSKGTTYVLGTGLSHDGSACLLRDGRVEVAIEKERITRIKHDGMNDSAAILYCLDAAGITINDIALVVQNANFSMLKSGNDWWQGRRMIPPSVPVVSISHHLAHAYSAVGTCPFEETAVLVLDGCGNAYDECLDLDGAEIPEIPASPDLQTLWFEKDSYYIYEAGKLQPVYKDFSPWGIGRRGDPMCPATTRHSIGGVYLAVSSYVFNGFDDPGKLMGLAPYGRPGVYDFEIFELRGGRVWVRYDWMTQFLRPARTAQDFKENFTYYADIAYWVQKELERAVLYLVRSRYETRPYKNLSYAGGVALNAVVNARIVRELPFENVYFQPAAQDNGLAIGCAYYGWLEVLKRKRVAHNGSTYFGRSYSSQHTKTILNEYSHVVDVAGIPDPTEDVAAALADGKVVAWFQKGAEFGPRALGHRSILADPRRAGVRDFINTEIKDREDFRPFAPAVPLEDVARFFDCSHESPYMILVAPVRTEWASAIPSVVHRDGSSRIQTVTEESNPAFHRLLRSFGAKTGIPILLNTSLNKRGMPIVETPEQAVLFFLSCPLDLLVVDGMIVRKLPAPQAASWDLDHFFNRDLQEALARRAREATLSAVYQIKIETTRAWTLDCSKEQPTVCESTKVDKPELKISLTEADLQRIIQAQSPRSAGLRLLDANRIKVEGKQTGLAELFQLLEFRPNRDRSLAAETVADASESGFVGEDSA